tara:strand:+ start:682 stop:849 length:168 start_codon:yes stop_codon:yes gene_type:complete
MVQKMLINAAIKLIAKQFKLDKVLKYVEEPNELDNKVDNLNDRLMIIEKHINKEK